MIPHDDCNDKYTYIHSSLTLQPELHNDCTVVMQCDARNTLPYVIGMMMMTSGFGHRAKERAVHDIHNDLNGEHLSVAREVPRLSQYRIQYFEGAFHVYVIAEYSTTV